MSSSRRRCSGRLSLLAGCVLSLAGISGYAGTVADAQPPQVHPPSALHSESAWIKEQTTDLVRAIADPHVSPTVALWTLLAALALGAVHALSPGHGKTIVAAYLIGSRGTPRHAAFLGFTVTVTHTIAVFAIGFATLSASEFIAPEKLLPLLSLLSGVLVLGMGVVLLVQRVRAASLARLSRRNGGAPVFLLIPAPSGTAGSLRSLMLAHQHGGAQDRNPGIDHGDLFLDTTMHSHGGGPMHSHLPPAVGSEKVTWKSLLTLGVSGGLVPCPSAMVLLLAAIALNKPAYGMLLVLAFSVGLATTLTLVGLAFLYARGHLDARTGTSRWPQILPLLSALSIMVLGVALCFGALRTFN